MTTPRLIQSSTQLPAQPVYILRGHPAPIHTLLFLRNNTRLLSGDAEGWVVLWSIAIKRPVAVWKAHEATVLGAAVWKENKIITHGRDGKICVWSLGPDDEAGLSTDLPLESEDASHRKQPWLLHALEAPTMNFCAFSGCEGTSLNTLDLHNKSTNETVRDDIGNAKMDKTPRDTLLIAIAGAEESEIVIYRLPDEKKVGVIPPPDQTQGKTGMVMALRIFQVRNGEVAVIAGYESGRTYVYKQIPEKGFWEVRYTSKPHSQPILSLDVDMATSVYFTSSADAIIAKHPLSLSVKGEQPLKEVQTKHAGQQGLQVRSDRKIIATAGWDSRVRVYSARTLKELAVLKWHKDGCFVTAFAVINVIPDDQAIDSDAAEETQVHSVPHNTHIIHQSSIEQSRNAKAQSTHWLAAGSKDGKISLWDIY